MFRVGSRARTGSNMLAAGEASAGNPCLNGFGRTQSSMSAPGLRNRLMSSAASLRICSCTSSLVWSLKLFFDLKICAWSKKSTFSSECSFSANFSSARLPSPFFMRAQKSRTAGARLESRRISAEARRGKSPCEAEVEAAQPIDRSAKCATQQLSSAERLSGPGRF